MERMIYEVNLEIEQTFAGDFEEWLAEHVKAILRIEGFEGATVYRRRPEDEGRGHGGPLLLTVHYRVRDRASLDAYLSGPAAAMRREGTDRFGGKFTATRRVLEPA